MLPNALFVPPHCLPLPPSCDAIEAALREADANAARVTVACSFVLHHCADDDLSAYALVSGGGIAFAAGAEICVNGWPVVLLSADCPIGRAVTSRPAGLGDSITIRLPSGENKSAAVEAQIVSWNGSPILTNEERRDCRKKQAEREQAVQNAQAEQRKRAALRAKEDGMVANLRARRLANEAALRHAQNG